MSGRWPLYPGGTTPCGCTCAYGASAALFLPAGGVFTERLPTLVAPYGRRTLRLREVLGVIVIALGGEAGARLATRLGMPASPATLELLRFHGHLTAWW